VWLTPREEIPSWGTPTIYEGQPRAELITHATKFIRAYDPMTGKELWRLSGNSEVTTPTPFVAHNLIFITNGYRVIQPIYAIRPGGSGDITLKEGQESSDFIAWSKKRGGPYMSTPVVYGEHLYVCSMQGIIACYNSKTGERLYQQRLGEGGAYSASPVAADGKVYFTSEDGDIFVVKAGSKYELLATNPIGEVCMASPAISGGMIFVRAEHHVFAIGERPAALQLVIPAFNQGAAIPRQHTCDDADLAPALEWSGEPSGTQSFALIVDDPDAPVGTWNHWLLYDIPASLRSLAQGFKPGHVGLSGVNDFGRQGYGGPCPPKGHGPHRYFFRLYAVDVPSLGLKAGANRSQLDRALAARVLAEAQYMGRYERK
jgi:Raf kinase inhibitor-like YbhB/YbcL family protein